MKATTEATKLNFITDQGSSRDRVSIAWRLFDRRTDRTDRTDGAWLPLLALRSERFCQKPETEPASPAAAPLIPAAAAVAVEEKPESDGPAPALAPFGVLKPAESAEVAVSWALCQAERE
jgi:hypothetical protein